MDLNRSSFQGKLVNTRLNCGKVRSPDFHYAFDLLKLFFLNSELDLHILILICTYTPLVKFLYILSPLYYFSVLLLLLKKCKSI
jgi:hypothetical protein